MNAAAYEAGYAAARRAVDVYAGGDRDKVWGSMVYACSGRQKRDGYDLPPCGHEQRYYVGVGVEGPPAVRARLNREFRLPEGEWGSPGYEDALVAETDRVGVGFIPCPAYAGRCPNCHGGTLMHVRWADDETFDDFRNPPAGARYFRVPDAATAAKFARDDRFGGAELVVAP